MFQILPDFCPDFSSKIKNDTRSVNYFFLIENLNFQEMTKISKSVPRSVNYFFVIENLDQRHGTRDMGPGTWDQGHGTRDGTGDGTGAGEAFEAKTLQLHRSPPCSEDTLYG